MIKQISRSSENIVRKTTKEIVYYIGVGIMEELYLKGILLLKQDSYEKLESEKVVIKMDFR